VPWASNKTAGYSEATFAIFRTGSSAPLDPRPFLSGSCASIYKICLNKIFFLHLRIVLVHVIPNLRVDKRAVPLKCDEEMGQAADTKVHVIFECSKLDKTYPATAPALLCCQRVDKIGIRTLKSLVRFNCKGLTSALSFVTRSSCGCLRRWRMAAI